MIDATGRTPIGLFQGTLADLGAFDQCVETVLTSDEGEETLRGQYCNVYVKSPHGDYTTHIANITRLSHRRVSCLRSKLGEVQRGPHASTTSLVRKNGPFHRPNHVRLSYRIVEYMWSSLMIFRSPQTPKFIKFQDAEEVPGIRIGMCLTTDCDKEDLQKLAKKFGDSLVVDIRVGTCITNLPKPVETRQLLVL